MTPDRDDRIGVPKDELEFDDVEVRTPKRHRVRWLIILIILIAGAGAGWYYLGNQFSPDRQKSVPVVRADVSPVKIKPADPGGLDVPNRDKLVYDRLNGGSGSTEVESLLPPPEEPLEVPVSVQTPPVPESNAPTTLELQNEASTSTPEAQAPVAPEPSPVPETSAATLAPKAPPPVPVETVEAAELIAPSTPESAAQPAATTTATPAVPTVATPTVATPTVATPTVATPTVAASTSRRFRIQLAALRTHGGAEAEWKRLKNAHPDILGPLTMFVVMVDLGGNQGIYYRLRAGNMNTKETAKAVCDRLAVRNVACLVIRSRK